MSMVAGVDVAAGRWVVVAADPTVVSWVAEFGSFDAALAELEDASVIGVDIPIGLEANDWRECDQVGRRMLGRRSSTLFPTPPRAALVAGSYAEARDVAVRLTGRSVSAQAYNLRHRILEVEPQAVTDDRIREVHPELSFALMAGEPLAEPKTTWNGQMRRRRLLASVGLVLPDDLPRVDRAAPDDVLDAAAVAWSARRVAAGVAERIPPDATGPAIWR